MKQLRQAVKPGARPPGLAIKPRELSTGPCNFPYHPAAAPILDLDRWGGGMRSLVHDHSLALSTDQLGCEFQRRWLQPSTLR